MNIAVVTGASSGMGKEFVLALDKQYELDEIWVVARREQLLCELQSEVSAKIVVLPLDLTKEESFEKYKNALKESCPNVKVLVNAAGFGKFLHFEKTPLASLMQMVDLNSKALMAITYLTLPYVKEGGEIYQMGSLSSFQPVPCINVYGATKAFVLSFSRALNVELAPKKIKVMAVCPGWIKTEFFSHAIEDQTINYFNRYYTPQQVVKKALIDMKKGKDVSILGFPVRMQVRAVKLLPTKMVMKIWCKQQKINTKPPKNK
ncbi:MAG: SDR family NAD(P)-dependent oxidoreductase [Clostridia bacterium]|nr:SDR family NAD(P)-dependent oxidoreductase [Clostridia bacterium]